MRREVAARAGVHRHVERDRDRQRPHRVGLRLLLEGHREHPLVHAGLHQRRRRRCAVEPPTEPAVCTRSSGLPGRAERVGQEQLGHHHALEQVGRLADDDRVDVVPADLRVGQRAVDGLAQQAGHRDVLALGAVVGLAGAEHGGELLAITRASMHADEVLLQGRAARRVGEHLGRARRTRSGSAASPMRIEAGGEHRVAGSAPPEGLIRTSSPSPSSARRISSWWVNGACSSATSTPSRSRLAAARSVEGERSGRGRPCSSGRRGARCR